MKTIIKNCIALALTAGSLAGCNKFLNEPPSKTSSLVVTTTTQLNALLNDYTQFYAENNSTEILSTDDYGLTTPIYDAGPGLFSPIVAQYNTWDTAYLMDDPGQSFWSSEYSKIFTANMVLQYADKVTGSNEDKANLKADAHFIRAYSYFQLANTFTLPYSSSNGEEPGLPLKLSIAFDEPVARAPLSKVYQQIEADLTEAMKVKLPLVQNGRPRHWRANTAAVNGFAARYYLAMNKYADALKYADQALQEYSTLVDYNTEMHYGRDEQVTVDPGPSEQTVTLKFPYTHNNQDDFTDMIGWPEFLYFRMLDYGREWYMPSTDLLNLYDQAHDLRYLYHYVEGYSYHYGMIDPAYNYPGYIFFYNDRIPSGPTTAEMLLIKAEAQARTGDFGSAMTTLNSLRAKRMTPGAWVNLTATDKDDAIIKVLEERRREMPFVHRWYDVRRYNNNDDPNDDVVMSKTFYPYTLSSVQSNQPVKTYSLPKNSRRFAAPLPRTEIISSNGAIQQNKY